MYVIAYYLNGYKKIHAPACILTENVRVTLEAGKWILELFVGDTLHSRLVALSSQWKGTQLLPEKFCY